MNVTLDTDIERAIRDKVATGRYSSASEVIREGVRLLQERDEWEQMQKENLQREIATGLQQLQEGRSTVLNQETLAGIKERGRAHLAEQAQGSDG